MDETIALPIWSPGKRVQGESPVFRLVYATLCSVAEWGAHRKHRASLEWQVCYKPRSLRKRIIGLNVLSIACVSAKGHSRYTSRITLPQQDFIKLLTPYLLRRAALRVVIDLLHSTSAAREPLFVVLQRELPPASGAPLFSAASENQPKCMIICRADVRY